MPTDGGSHGRGSGGMRGAAVLFTENCGSFTHTTPRARLTWPVLYKYNLGQVTGGGRIWHGSRSPDNGRGGAIARGNGRRGLTLSGASAAGHCAGQRAAASAAAGGGGL